MPYKIELPSKTRLVVFLDKLTLTNYSWRLDTSLIKRKHKVGFDLGSCRRFEEKVQRY